MKKLYALIVAVLFTTYGYAATVSTAPNVRICTNSYTGIGNIVISEAAAADFAVGTNYYLFIVAPTGFEFNPAAGVAITVAGANNVANQSILFKTTSVIAVKYDITNTNQTDVITISNITMKALSLSGAAGTVTVGTGSYLANIAVGSTLATVSSALSSLSFTAPAATCTNNGVISLIGTAADAPAGGVGASSGFSGTGVTGTNFNPATAGAGSHTLTYTVNTTTPTCTYTVTSDMVVNQAPVVSMSSSEISGNNPNDNDVCTADNITFTAYGATSYQFKIDGVNSSTTNPWVWTPGAGNVGARSITVVGTTGGCSTTSSAIATDVFLKPNAPTFNPTVTTFDISLSGFKLDTLNPDATPAITANSYFSQASGSGIGGTNNNYFYPGIAGNGSYVITYNYVDGNGCRNNSAGRTINVTSSPAPGVISGLGTSYCVYDPAVTISVLQASPIFTNYQFEYYNQTTATWVPMVTTTTGVSGSYTYSASFDPAVLSLPANGGPGAKQVRYQYLFDFGWFSFWLWSDPAVASINLRPTVDILNPLIGWSCQSDPQETLLPFPSSGGTSVFTSPTAGSAGLITNSAGTYYLNRNGPTINPSGSIFAIRHEFTDASTGCTNFIDKNVYIDRTPAVPVVVTPPVYCQGDYVTNLEMTSTSNGTLRWYRYGLPTVRSSTSISSGGGGGSSFYSPGVLAVTDTFTATMTNIYNTCTSAQSANLRVIMNTPATVDAGVYSNVCSSNPTVTLAGSRTPGGLGITWSSSVAPTNSGFTNLTITNPDYTAKVAEVSAGVMTLFLTTADPDGIGSGCPAVSDFTQIFINTAPTISAGPDATFCSNSLVTLLGSYGSTTTASAWYKNSVGGSQIGISTPLSIFSTYTPTLAEKNGGPITFVIESNDPDGAGPCTAVNDQVTITINPEAVVSAGVSTVSCGAGGVSLVGTCTRFGGAALGATWTGGAGGVGAFAPNNTTLTATYTPTLAESLGGSIFFTLTSADPDGAGPCTALASSVFKTINLAPTINAGPDATFCSSTDPVLTATLGGSTSALTWSRLGVGGTINTPLNTTTTYTIPVGEKSGTTITFVATSNDPDGAGPCVAVSDQVAITVNPEVLVDAGSSIVTCGSANVALSGTCVTYGGGNLAATWSKGIWNSGLIAAGTNPKNATYTPTVGEATSGGSYAYFLTSADPDGVGPTGPCPALSDFVINSINPAPFVNAGVDATWCSNTTPSITAILTGSATSLTWTKSSGSGTILSPTSPITDYIVSPGDYALGTPLSIDFTATTNDPDGAGPCVVATDVVTITLNPHLTVDAGTDIVVCAGQTINTAGNVKIGGIDRLTALVNNWSVVVGAGSTTQNGPSNFTGNYLPTGNMLTNTGELGLGASMILQLTSNDPDGAGPCTVASDLVRVTINQRARVSAGADTVFCANDVMNLNGSMLTGSTDFVTWTGRPLSSFNSAYIVNPIYTPIAPSELYGNTYNAATGTILPNQITFTITGNDPDGAGPCTAENDDVVVSINPMVTVNAGTDMAFCGHTLQTSGMMALVNSANIKLGNTDRLTTAPAVNSWSIVSGTGTQSGINFASNFNVNYAPSGTLADSGTVTSNGSLELGNLSTITLQLSTNDPDGAGPCLASSDQVSLTIYPRPITHFVGFETEYCRNTDDVKYLQGNIFSSVSNNALFSIVGGVNASISTSGDNFVFSPSDASINNNGATFDVRYRQSIKEDLTNTCYNYVDTTVRVFPIPQVNFTASSRCQGDTITFTETAAINSSVFPGTEIDWDWYIDNDTIDNSVTPNISSLNRPSTLYSFLNYGNHTIKLITTTNSGGVLNCVNQIDTTLIFGPYPMTNYSWLNPCSVDSVAFTNNTTIAPGYSNSITWNFNGVGALKNGSTNTTPNPYYQYSQPGIYNAQLIATTNIYNCIKIKTKEVFVVPTYAITGSDPYDSSFATNLNWAPSSAFSDSLYSWMHGTPAGKQVINPGSNVWITNLTGGYRIGERSYLNSPCFNMQALDKPMMVLKAWSNSRNLAGTVLESSIGNTNTWQTVGQIGDGLNWYDTQGIVGLIGASASNPIAQGFSGEDANWEVSRIGLSQFSNQTNLVKFRLVFGSSNVNDPLNVRDGIALDSIWIGNRSKVVLAEHFTNSLCPSCIEANDTVNSIQAARPVDMVSVHYHTSFPGADNMNVVNPSDPSSKVLFYGVSNTPRSFVDGTQMFSEYGNSANALTLSSIDTKALENAKFKLDLSTTKSGLNLNVKTQIVATEPLAQDIVLNIAVLEDYVSGGIVGGNQSGYKWVLKKMLPDAAGSYISKNWAVNDTLKTNMDWAFTLSSFYDTSKIVVVAFVQNYSTKEVYQAVKISSNGNTSTPIITAVEPQDLASNLLIYPVPADNEVNVLFANDIAEDTEYSLTDDVGKVVERGVIEQGVRMLSFNTKKYAAGMYYLSIPKPDGSKIVRKIVVIH